MNRLSKQSHSEIVVIPKSVGVGGIEYPVEFDVPVLLTEAALLFLVKGRRRSDDEELASFHDFKNHPGTGVSSVKHIYYRASVNVSYCSDIA